MGMIKEFKEFAMKGNVMDMAVGIIIGAAFGKVITSFVKDVLMPPIGLLLGGVDFSDLAINLNESTVADDGTVTEAVSLNYGLFVNTALDFIIVAFAIFMMIKAMNSMKKKEEAAPAKPPEPTKEETLLTEIRDVLQARS